MALTPLTIRMSSLRRLKDAGLAHPQNLRSQRAPTCRTALNMSAYGVSQGLGWLLVIAFSVTTAMANPQFSVGELHGWRGVLLGLGGSLLFLVAGWQDVGGEFGMGSSGFWFLLALTFTGGVIWLAIGAEIWGGLLLGLLFFCLEIWLIQRWWRKAQYI